TTNLIKTGAGRMEVDAIWSLPTTTINQGDVQVDGRIVDAVLNGATASLSGTGVVGRILGSGSGTPTGTIDPGDNRLKSPNATLTTNGSSSTLGSGTNFFVDLDDSAAGAGTGYDQLVVDGGTLKLNGAMLTGLATANVDNGDSFTIIQAKNGGEITGHFDETSGAGVAYT